MINRKSWRRGSTSTHPRMEVAAAERHHRCQEQGDEGPEMAAASEHTAGEYIGYPAGTSTPRVWFGGVGSYPGAVARKPNFSVQIATSDREKPFGGGCGYGHATRHMPLPSTHGRDSPVPPIPAGSGVSHGAPFDLGYSPSIAGPVAKAAGPLVFRERRRETSAAFSRFGPRSARIGDWARRGRRLWPSARHNQLPSTRRPVGAIWGQSLSRSLFRTGGG